MLCSGSAVLSVAFGTWNTHMPSHGFSLRSYMFFTFLFSHPSYTFQIKHHIMGWTDGALSVWGCLFLTCVCVCVRLCVDRIAAFVFVLVYVFCSSINLLCQLCLRESLWVNICTRARVCSMFINLCGDQTLDVYYTCGDRQLLWGQNPRPHECKGIYVTPNVFLVSGLQLCYG